ncbi:hypothetical protein G6553_01580 [Nocardioides sp. IC4_145]|uniref:hypothetical protein n=1 Tax=Nocardioides sp. IC4_145 TaxID=2714037 RepID=UPI0014098F28|nr:hypothetical protein [Nocardioides sp. IC4_145]NHC21865.1 hypothetical protein [Nocardioides sp. IC4_145]
MTRTRTGLLLLALSFLAGGCGSAADAGQGSATDSETTSISGVVLTKVDTFALLRTGLAMSDDEKYEQGVTPCKADKSVTPGVKQGAQVVVRDANGTTIGTATLGAGVMSGRDGQAPINSPCGFEFEVLDVPADSAFYAFQVGEEAELTVPAAEVASVVELRLR